MEENDNKLEKKCFLKRVFRYPYKAVRKVARGVVYYSQYIHSLWYMRKQKQRVYEKIKNNEKLNVVFIVQYVPGWNKLESIYMKMKEDVRFNPFIVCVPLNIENHKLLDNKKNDTYCYFVEHGYDVINALNTDGSWYNLELLGPDYIFHSRPYNYVMPETYMSSNLVKTALICNVLYGPSLTRNEQNVVLNKDYFKNVYMYFAFDSNEGDFYEKRYKLGIMVGIQKCMPYGALGLEHILGLKYKKIDNGFKKTVLWTPRWSTDAYIGGSNFFKYKDIIINLTKEFPDILFIFRPHPLMFGNFLKTGEMSSKEVESFKTYCRVEDNIILDETKSYEEKFWNSDFMITDLSGVVPEYFVTEKPIMYCCSDAKFEFVDYASSMIKACYEVNNCNDFRKYFIDLINGNDGKKGDRIKCVNQYFSDVKRNSMKILQELAGEEGC